MPLRYADLLPGDILLCYGWKQVAGTPVLSFSSQDVIELGAASDPIPGLDRFDCNHAIIIGRPYEWRPSEEQVVPLAEARPGDTVTFERKPDDTYWVRIKKSDPGTVTEYDFTQILRGGGFAFRT